MNQCEKPCDNSKSASAFYVLVISSVCSQSFRIPNWFLFIIIIIYVCAFGFDFASTYKWCNASTLYSYCSPQIKLRGKRVPCSSPFFRAYTYAHTLSAFLSVLILFNSFFTLKTVMCFLFFSRNFFRFNFTIRGAFCVHFRLDSLTCAPFLLRTCTSIS